jgi:hypothetical protein
MREIPAQLITTLRYLDEDTTGESGGVLARYPFYLFCSHQIPRLKTVRDFWNDHR